MTQVYSDPQLDIIAQLRAENERLKAESGDTIRIPEGVITIHRGPHQGGFEFRPNAAYRLNEKCFADLDGGLVIVTWEPVGVQEGGEV